MDHFRDLTKMVVNSLAGLQAGDVHMRDPCREVPSELVAEGWADVACEQYSTGMWAPHFLAPRIPTLRGTPDEDAPISRS